MRYLVLSLDEENKNTLVLMEGDKDEIDKFTTQNFNNSEEIREFYKEKITKFLLENKDYIERVEERSKKSFRGSIVLLEYNEDHGNLKINQKRVLYKYYKVVVEEALKHQEVMRESVRIDRNSKTNLYTEYLQVKINYHNYGSNENIARIKRYINQSRNKYDIYRLIMAAYYNLRKEKRKLKTELALYREYLERKNKQKEEKEKTRIEQTLINHTINDEEYIYVDGFRYKVSDNPYDNEELLHQDVEGIVPDGIKKL